MPHAAVAGGANHPVAGAPTPGGAVVPFFYGSNQYVEKFFTNTTTLTTTQSEVQANINPGGYLRGVRILIRSTGGALGGGTLSGDAPWSVCASATLENVDGAPIIYPAPGFTHAMRQKYGRPWHGDPARRSGYSATVNPGGSLFLQPEIRQTAGVLANTDARAQFRIRFTFATLAQYISGGAPTGPAVTVTFFMEGWAQPDSKDLRGNQIEEIPPGLNLATISRRQILNLAAAGSDNTFQVANMGNEVRLFLLITRLSTGVRSDLLSDPIRWRLDNRSLGVFSPNEVFDRMDDFYDFLQDGGVRETGVYVFPRFYQPGKMVGESWLSTTNATYTIFESTTATGGTSGTIEVISDEVVPVGMVPLELESI